MSLLSGLPNGWRPELLAVDVDGTIVDYDDSLSPAVRSAVRAAAARTALVVATGRSLHATLPVLDALALRSGFVVCSNGAVLADAATGEPLEVTTFDASPAVRWVAEEVPDAVLAVEELGVGYRVTGEFPAGELHGKITVVPHEELLGGPVTRLVIRWPNGDRQRLIDLAESAGLHGVRYAIGYTAWLDVMPPGVSKASALELVRFRLGAASFATMAVGDGTNDVEMLRWAHVGVAMGQSVAEVVEAADVVTGTVSEDGLATVLARVFGAHAA